MANLADWIGSTLCDGLAKPLRRLLGNEADCAYDNTITGYVAIVSLALLSIMLMLIFMKVFGMVDKEK